MSVAPDRAPYGRRSRLAEEGRADVADPVAPSPGPRGDTPPTYYDLPAVKASHYRWLIASYFFVGGLAGAAQVIATVARLAGRRDDRAIVRAGRYFAVAGALASSVFLIGDLHTRTRWFNMLRIFRRTSPMSIGSWTLAVFGTFSGLVALGQALEDLCGAAAGGWLAGVFGLPAALAGMVMACYTGVLLAATSTPFWAAVPRLLPAVFGASGFATAAAALALAGEAGGASHGARRRLERLALVSSAVELFLTLGAHWQWRRHGLDAPLNQPPLASSYRFGALGLGIVAPLAIHSWQIATGRQSRLLSTLAAVSALAGGYTQRAVVLFAGNASGHDPEAYFRFAAAHRKRAPGEIAGHRLLPFLRVAGGTSTLYFEREP